MYRNCSHLLFSCITLQNSPFLTHSNIIFNVQCRHKSFRQPFKNISKSFKPKKCIVEETSLRNDQQGTSVVSSLIKPTVFTILFSSTSFIGATVWQYENMRHHAREIISTPQKWFSNKLKPSNLWLQEKFNGNFRIKKGSFRQFCNAWWNSLSEGHKIFIPILFCNLLVYVAWKIPSFRTVMSRYFVSDPTKTQCWSMLLNTFSHFNGIHLACNMFVLNSFIGKIVSDLGKEQFLAYYLTAGVVSSWCSLMYRVCFRDLTLSLGASGAVIGTLSYICFKYPDSQLCVIFLPFIILKAGTVIKLLMLSEFAWVLLKFRIFDHMAHLGGALFGLFWYSWGSDHIWKNRGPILEWWHKQRNRPR